MLIQFIIKNKFYCQSKLNRKNIKGATEGVYVEMFLLVVLVYEDPKRNERLWETYIIKKYSLIIVCVELNMLISSVYCILFYDVILKVTQGQLGTKSSCHKTCDMFCL